MQDKNTPRRRAIQALLQELAAKNNVVPETLLREIYDIEEGVQFLDDRGPIPERIVKLVQAELDKEHLE